MAIPTKIPMAAIGGDGVSLMEGLTKYVGPYTDDLLRAAKNLPLNNMVDSEQPSAAAVKQTDSVPDLGGARPTHPAVNDKTRELAENIPPSSEKTPAAMAAAPLPVSVPDQIENAIGTLATGLDATGGAIGMVDLVGIAGVGVAALGAKTGLFGAKATGNLLQKPQTFLNQSFGDMGKKIGVGAPKAVKDLPFGQTVMNATFVASPFLSAVNALRNAWNRLSLTGEINKQITGKDADAIELLSGNAPEMVKEAGNDVKRDLLNGLIQGAGAIYGAIGWKKHGTVPMKAFLIPMIAGMGLQAWWGDSSVTEPVKLLKKAAQSGNPISADVYAAVIGVADKELKTRGGANGPFARAVAERLEKEQVTPAELMKKISNGELEKEYVAAVMVESEPTRSPADETSMEPTYGTGYSHVQALNGIKPEKPALGNYTGNLLREAQMAQLAVPARE